MRDYKYLSCLTPRQVFATWLARTLGLRILASVMAVALLVPYYIMRTPGESAESFIRSEEMLTCIILVWSFVGTLFFILVGASPSLWMTLTVLGR